MSEHFVWNGRVKKGVGCPRSPPRWLRLSVAPSKDATYAPVHRPRVSRGAQGGALARASHAPRHAYLRASACGIVAVAVRV